MNSPLAPDDFVAFAAEDEEALALETIEDLDEAIEEDRAEWAEDAEAEAEEEAADTAEPMDDVIEAIADEAEPWMEDAAEAMDLSDDKMRFRCFGFGRGILGWELEKKTHDWTRVMLAVEEAVVSSVEDEEEPGLMVTPVKGWNTRN